MKRSLKPPKRAPTDPRDRRVFIDELKRAYKAGTLDSCLGPESIPPALLAAIFPGRSASVVPNLDRRWEDRFWWAVPVAESPIVALGE